MCGLGLVIGISGRAEVSRYIGRKRRGELDLNKDESSLWRIRHSQFIYSDNLIKDK